MRPQILIGLYAEGSTDERLLGSIVKRTFEAVGAECNCELEIMDIRNIKPDKKVTFADDVAAASREGYDKYSITVLCIHTDADNATDKKTWQHKIDPALAKVKAEQDGLCKIIVPIVPVRMTEAWMLADKLLLKQQIGTNKNDNELSINKNPEQYADPKETIAAAISIAQQGKSKRHRRDQDISGLYQSIGQSISLEALRKLSSFGKFEDNVRKAFRELKYLN